MPTLATSLRLYASSGHRTIDVAAGATTRTLVVADGMGGHGTGWLPARLAVRTLCERLTAIGPPHHVGCADKFPREWGWAGGLQDDDHASRVYAACEQLLAPATSTELTAIMMDLDSAIARIPELAFRITGPITSCTAVTLVGDRLLGAHTGIGRALLRRAAASQIDSLTHEHFLHEVLARRPDLYPGADPLTLPQNAIVGALGCLSRQDLLAGLDTFTCTLEIGDTLLLCSRRLPISDEHITDLLRPALALDQLLDDLVSATAAADERKSDITLALLRRTA